MDEESNDKSHGFGPLLQWSSENDVDFYHLTARQCSVSGGWSKAIFEEPREKPGMTVPVASRGKTTMAS